LYSGTNRPSTLIVLTSEQTVSRMMITLGDRAPVRLNRQALKNIDQWKSNRKFPFICTRDVYTTMCHRFGEFVQGFDTIFLVDGLISFDFWEKCIYFEDVEDNPQVVYQEKRKFEGDSFEISKLPKYEAEYEESKGDVIRGQLEKAVRTRDLQDLSPKPQMPTPPEPKKEKISPTVIANQSCLGSFKQPPKWEQQQIGTEWHVRMKCGIIREVFLGVGPNISIAKEKASIQYLKYMETFDK
jgi:hypothetical protein